MIISLTPNDRFFFHSAVATQDIQFLLNDLNSQLFYNTPTTLVTSLLGAQLFTPIHMGTGDLYQLPYDFIEFDTSTLQDATISIGARAVNDRFIVTIAHQDGYFINSTMHLHFDNYLTLHGFEVNFGPMAKFHPHERRMLMNAAFMDIPTILGYIVSTHRNRVPFTLGEVHDFTVRGATSPDSYQSLGDILQVTNPRDNETGITKRPHERAGHTRKLPDGRIIEVSPTTVHKDGYEPDGSPRKLKY